MYKIKIKTLSNKKLKLELVFPSLKEAEALGQICNRIDVLNCIEEFGADPDFFRVIRNTLQTKRVLTSGPMVHADFYFKDKGR